jgi:MerR family copper efflux transcriptional regulator
VIDHDPTYSIGEAARLSGFPAATLRYYDELGLVSPASRSGAGYRQYDARDLERLRFVEHAKQLDCSLDEIGDLLAAWDGGECGPLQDRLRSVVAGKIADGQARLLTLTTLLVELQRSAAALERHRPVGACDERCGCTSTDAITTTGISLGAKPAIACTLTPEAMPQRLADFTELFTHVVNRHAVDQGLRLEFDHTLDVGELASLIRAEQECCQFWEFALTVDTRGVALEVRGPDGTADLIDGLFGVPA